MRSPIRWGAVTVPYIAMWTAEIERRAPFVRHERWDGRRIAMLCEGVTAQEGKPVFKMLHADRCREVVREGLCQMCVRPLPDVVITVNQGQVDHYRPLISDGLPMCPACAAEALNVCPGMQRQAAAGSLRLWESRREEWLIAPVLLGVAPKERGGDERINRLILATRQPVFTGPKLVLRSFRMITQHDLREMVDA